MRAFDEFLGRFFKRVLYVQIWRNRLRVLDANSGATFDDESWVAIGGNPKSIVAVGKAAKGAAELVVNPFGHPRSLFSDFTVAEQLIRRAVRSLKTSWWLPAPVMVMHPREMIEGGLTQIESRVLRELALGAGARQVFLCALDRSLSTEELGRVNGGDTRGLTKD